MAIVSGDIDFRLSGGAANSVPSAALGGAKSSVEVVTNVVENLFPNVTGTQSAAGLIDYLCIYYHNSHGSLTANNSKVYITSNTTSTGDTLDLAVGTSAVNATEQTIASITTAPTGVSWVTNATDYATGVALGNIPAGQHRALWIRRTVTAGAAAKDNNVATLEVGVDSAE